MEEKFIKHLLSKKVSRSEFNALKQEIDVLERDSFKDRAFSIDNWEYEFCENPFSVILLIYDVGKLIGLLDYWITFDSATIFRIEVSVEYQNKGIGTRLMNLMIKDLNEQETKVSYITLEVRESNIKAIKLYKKFDFNELNIKNNYYNDGENAIFMGKGI